MGNRFILGIADNDHFASAVVGDLSGRITATCIGRTVNYQYVGMEQARKNFRDLIRQTIGWEKRSRLAGACFTYKGDFALADWGILELVSGYLQGVNVTVEDFATSSLLGMGGDNRLLLVGGHCALAILEDADGRQYASTQDRVIWSPLVRIRSKLKETKNTPYRECKEGLLFIKQQLKMGKPVTTFADHLDELVGHGSLLALEVAHDIAFDLVQMAMDLFSTSNARESTIGLYGSVLLGSETIRSRVEYLLHLLYPECSIMEVPLAPAKGAYLSSLLARRSLSCEEMITRMCN